MSSIVRGFLFFVFYNICQKEDDTMTDKTPPISTHIVSCGSRTYFFDVKQAKNDNKYIKITESRLVKDTNEKKRTSFILFTEDVVKFADALSQARSDMSA